MFSFLKHKLLLLQVAITGKITREDREQAWNDLQTAAKEKKTRPFYRAVNKHGLMYAGKHCNTLPAHSMNKMSLILPSNSKDRIELNVPIPLHNAGLDFGTNNWKWFLKLYCSNEVFLHFFCYRRPG